MVDLAVSEIAETPPEETDKDDSAEGVVRRILVLALGIGSVGASVYGILVGAGGVVTFAWGLFALVALHEGGHYVVARRAGMAASEVGIGFGPVIGAWRRRDLRYSVRMIPAGAFVRIVGMSPREKLGEVPEEQTYRSATWLRQVAVVGAGPLVNVLLAVMLFVLSAVGTGRTAPWLEVVSTSGPAAAAGITPGSTILGVDGRHYQSDGALLAAIRSAVLQDHVVQLDIKKAAKDSVVSLHPMKTASGWRVGIFEQYGSEPVGVLGAIRLGTERTWQTVDGIWSGLLGVFSPRAITTAIHSLSSTSYVPSPSHRYVSIVGIVQVGIIAGQTGWGWLLYFLALVSLAVGFVNLLPVLPLDGGHIVRAIGRRTFAGRRRLAILGRAVWQVGTVLGLGALLLITASAIWVDILHPITARHLG